jgi:ketosteroid isomerase-like protein
MMDLRPTLKILRAAGVVGLALPLFLAGACSEKLTPEQAVLKTLKAGIQGLGDGDVNAAADTLHEDYKDKGGRNRKQMKAMAFFYLRQGPVSVVLSDTQVKVEGNTATVKTGAVAVQGKVIPDRARQLTLTISLVKDGDQWLVTAIDGEGIPATPGS